MNLSNASRTLLSRVPGANRAVDFLCARANQVWTVDHDPETGYHTSIRTASIDPVNAAAVITGAGAAKLNYLGGANGSTTSANAENLGSLVMTGFSALTARDKLLVLVMVKAVTADTTNVRIFNVSDSLDLHTGTNAVAGNYYVAALLLRRSPDNNLVMFSDGYTATGGTFGPWSGMGGAGLAIATGWTNKWRIALRHDGVTATGTLYYDVSFYRIAGQ